MNLGGAGVFEGRRSKDLWQQQWEAERPLQSWGQGVGGGPLGRTVREAGLQRARCQLQPGERDGEPSPEMDSGCTCGWQRWPAAPVGLVVPCQALGNPTLDAW